MDSQPSTSAATTQHAKQSIRRWSSPIKNRPRIQYDEEDVGYLYFLENLEQPKQTAKVRRALNSAFISGNTTNPTSDSIPRDLPADGKYRMVFDRSFDLQEFEAFEDFAYSEAAVDLEELRNKVWHNFNFAEVFRQPVTYCTDNLMFNNPYCWEKLG